MKINHTVTHYALAAVLAGGLLAVHSEKPAPQLVPAAMHSSVKPDRHDWPVLGQEKTIALAEAIQARGQATGLVTIFCASVSCHDFRTDLDDAFQLADWKTEFEDRPVESEADHGLFVGPPGKAADDMVKELKHAAGIEATIVGITDENGKDIKGIGIIIGKAGAAQ